VSVAPAENLAALVPAADVSSVELADELVLYRPGCAEVHVLNVTGCEIWDLLTTGLASDAIANALAQAYGIPVAAALADVNEILERLQQAGLLVQRGR